jgi:pyruvate dehydrogenase E1 component beta subunit
MPKGFLIAAIRDPDPVIFFEPKRLYRAFRQEVPEGDYTVPIGKASVVREGSDVTVISWGAMVRVCLEAIESLENVSVELIDLRTLKPLDVETILNSVAKTGRVVIVQEAPRTCSLSSELTALITEKALLQLQAPVVRVTGYDTHIPYLTMEQYYLPDAGRVKKGIEKVLQF